MSDHEILNEVTSVAREVGDRVRALPSPAPFRTLSDLRAVFNAIDDSLQAFTRERLAALRPEAAWVG